MNEIPLLDRVYAAIQGKDVKADDGKPIDHKPTLLEAVWATAKANRERATASATYLKPIPAPTNPPRWTPGEAARFLQMVARTDDLTGNCC